MGVISVTAQKLEEIVNYYKPYYKSKIPPYSLFSANVNDTTITGYKSGKIVFQGHNEANEMALWDDTLPQQQTVIDSNVDVIAFVDGSFNKVTNQYGSGVLLLDGQTKEMLEQFSFAGSDVKYVDSHQIAGEVFACLKAIHWAIKNKKKSIAIYYDYEGIHSWALGKWKTNKSVSQMYKQYFDKFNAYISVTFVKVKAHSGVTENELVDSLAKKAVGLA